MHQLVLITAMTATTGLFGGKQCGKPHHGRKAVAASSCYSASPCGASYAASPCGAAAPAPYAAPSMQSYAPAPQAAPMAPVKMAPPAPPAPTPTSLRPGQNGSFPVVSTGGVR
jgi:hypothetical protein